MLFKYKSIDDKGIKREGEIDAANRDMAISGLQRRGFIVLSISEAGNKGSVFDLSFFDKVSNKDVVVLSRQIATLFGAQVSALKAFSMLASNAENKLLGKKLNQVSDDLQAGLSISNALAKHPDVFSDFYINMVKVGEETGKLTETFSHLADYLDRQYALTSKTKNALIYPVFVIFTFFAVMILMFTVVIPKIGDIIKSSGVVLPVYTKIILATSDFIVSYGILLLIIAVAFGIWVWRLASTESGKNYIDKKRLRIPAVGDLYKKMFLSRIADNLDTMLSSGVPVVKSINVTGDVVGSIVYKTILREVEQAVKSGSSLSSALEKYPEEMPGIMVQMVKVGEETGQLGPILKTLSDFYRREVDNAIDTLVGMIEPAMIVVLGLGVGVLLISVLMPIYDMTGTMA